jgi:hypothetical protein
MRSTRLLVARNLALLALAVVLVLPRRAGHGIVVRH